MFDPAVLPARLREFFNLWERKREARRLPARADFSLDELAPWMERLHLIEVLPDGDFFFRVFATKSAIRLDREYTGRRMSELPQNWVAQDALIDYRRVVGSAEPIFADRTRRHEDNRMYSWKRLILPLGRAPAIVEHLFVCLEYDFI